MWVICFCLYLGVGLESSWKNKVIFYSFLNVNELAGSPLCVTLLRNFNLRNVVHIDEKSAFANVVNSDEKLVLH